MKTGGKKGPQSTYKTHSTTNIHTHWCQHAEDIQRPKVFLFFVIFFFLHAYLFEQQQIIFIKFGDLALSVFDDLLWAPSQDEPRVLQNGDYSVVLCFQTDPLCSGPMQL